MRIQQALDCVDDNLGKERRDLQREASGQPPIEGVGTAVRHPHRDN
jgi:hypothetical protein